MTEPTRIRIIPRKGLKLRDPRNAKPILAEDTIDPKTEKIVHAGLVMLDADFKGSTFWQRRLRDGDITTELVKEG